MNNYLEYLEKLQKEMNLDEKVNRDELEKYRELYSKYSNLASLFGFLAIMLTLSIIFIAPYSRIGIILVMMMAFGSMCFVAGFVDKSEHYYKLMCNERDKVYNLNYSNIKNIIVNDGYEYMQQLVTWERMCELSDSDKEKYADLLRIVHDICCEYVIFFGGKRIG